jgi:uncharacterized membrane protein YdbT with pleckstrin-like domain
MEEFELEPGEHVITQVRQHLFVLFLRILPLVFMAIAPFIVEPILSAILSMNEGAQAVAASGLSPSFRFFVGLWWLLAWMMLFHIVTKYFLTVWVITSHRIVDIEQIGFFRRKVSSFLLVRVQDVTTDIHGILATLIGYGDINVETAGGNEEFRMRGIRSPEYIRDIIMTEVAKLHHSQYDAAKEGV